MEGREERDPGYDDWFDEPEPPREPRARSTRDVYDDAEESWVLPGEDESGGRGRGGIVIAGRTLTTTQVVIIGVSALALLIAILAAAGVFSGGKAAVPPVPTTTTPPPTATQATTAQTATTPTVQAPSQTLSPGDSGDQVKDLQRSLNALNYSVGKVDGFYGPATQTAVEQFQAANGLAQDGVVGPETLAKLNQQLSG